MEPHSESDKKVGILRHVRHIDSSKRSDYYKNINVTSEQSRKATCMMDLQQSKSSGIHKFFYLFTCYSFINHNYIIYILSVLCGAGITDYLSIAQCLEHLFYIYILHNKSLNQMNQPNRPSLHTDPTGEPWVPITGSARFQTEQRMGNYLND